MLNEKHLQKGEHVVCKTRQDSSKELKKKLVANGRGQTECAVDTAKIKLKHTHTLNKEQRQIVKNT